MRLLFEGSDYLRVVSIQRNMVYVPTSASHRCCLWKRSSADGVTVLIDYDYYLL